MNCATPWGLLQFFLSPQSLSSTCQYIFANSWIPAPMSFLEYLPYLAVTLLFEAPIYYLFFWRKKRSLKSGTVDLLFLNLLSHPFVVLILPGFFDSLPFAHYLATADTLAVGLEWGYLALRGYGLRGAFAAALVANLASWSLGVSLFLS